MSDSSGRAFSVSLRELMKTPVFFDFEIVKEKKCANSGTTITKKPILNTKRNDVDLSEGRENFRGE